MLRIYAAPNGRTYQYEEGTQPEGYTLAATQPKGAETPAKARTARNKARKTTTK